MVQVERRGKKLNPTIGFVLFCLFSKSPRLGTANLFANGCKQSLIAVVDELKVQKASLELH